MGRLLGVVALFAALALAQQPPPVSQQLNALHAQVELLVQGGQDAAGQGATIVMRRYGERLARDYARMDQYLLSRAAGLGMRLSAVAPPPWTAPPGGSFDLAFLAWAARQIQQLQSVMRAAVQEHAQAPLADLAQSMLPLLELHQQLTAALQQAGAPV